MIKSVSQGDINYEVVNESGRSESWAFIKDHYGPREVFNELRAEPSCVFFVKDESMWLDLLNDVIVVAVVDVHVSFLANHRPTHHNSLPSVSNDVSDEIVFKNWENMFSHLERLHVIIGLTQLDHLTEVHLGHDWILRIRWPIITLSIIAFLIMKFSDVFAPTAAKIYNTIDVLFSIVNCQQLIKFVIEVMVADAIFNISRVYEGSKNIFIPSLLF